MNISQDSLIYKFQRDSYTSNGARHIPDNLCPYMRRFLRLCLGTTILVSMFLFLAINLIALPIIWFMSLPFDDFCQLLLELEDLRVMVKEKTT